MIDDDLYAGPLAVTEAITAAVATIRDCWGEILDPPSGNGSGARSALITAGDHDDSDADIDWATRIVSLCAHVAASLNGWCRVVMEDRPITSPKALPLGGDVPGMCIFLARHAEWLSRYDDAASSCAEELREWAKKVLALTRPPRREWIYLGACPFVTVDTDGRGRICRGRVRVAVGSDGDQAACSEHGDLAPIGWWESAMGINLTGRIVGTNDLVLAIAERLRMTVTARTVRNWARQGLITAHVPFGPIEDPTKPRRAWWFDLGETLDQVAMMDRECTMCGKSSPGGSMCLRCLAVAHDGPIFAEQKNDWPIRGVPC